jgi:hypothetical protein
MMHQGVIGAHPEFYFGGVGGVADPEATYKNVISNIPLFAAAFIYIQI